MYLWHSTTDQSWKQIHWLNAVQPHFCYHVTVKSKKQKDVLYHTLRVWVYFITFCGPSHFCFPRTAGGLSQTLLSFKCFIPLWCTELTIWLYERSPKIINFKLIGSYGVGGWLVCDQVYQIYLITKLLYSKHLLSLGSCYSSLGWNRDSPQTLGEIILMKSKGWIGLYDQTNLSRRWES